MDNNNIIKSYIAKNPDLTSADIARLILKENPSFNNTFGHLRHKVAEIRKGVSTTPMESRAGNETSQEITKLVSKSIKTLDDLIRVCEIDTDVWTIKRWVCNKWEMGTRIEDKVETVPLFQVKAWLELNHEKKNLIDIKNELIAEIKKYKPVSHNITYPKSNNLMYEICPFDVHFGKLTWGEETNFDYDIKIAAETVMKCVKEHLDNALRYKTEKFLFVVGNDFFNSDNKSNTTSGGTPQDEDTRWRKTFKKGRLLMIECIDMLSKHAPVDVVVIPGNHDLERSFYLGDSLECWYNSSKYVKVDNSPRSRKYYEYGNCLIGFTHGKDEKIANLPTIMALESPSGWSVCKHREWHLGDKHHSKRIDTVSIDEKDGVTTRILRSVSPADQWHYGKGYIGAIRGMEGFLWDKERGLKATYLSKA